MKIQEENIKYQNYDLDVTDNANQLNLVLNDLDENLSSVCELRACITAFGYIAAEKYSEHKHSNSIFIL